VKGEQSRTVEPQELKVAISTQKIISPRSYSMFELPVLISKCEYKNQLVISVWTICSLWHHRLRSQHSTRSDNIVPRHVNELSAPSKLK